MQLRRVKGPHAKEVVANIAAGCEQQEPSVSFQVEEDDDGRRNGREAFCFSFG